VRKRHKAGADVRASAAALSDFTAVSRHAAMGLRRVDAPASSGPDDVHASPGKDTRAPRIARKPMPLVPRFQIPDTGQSPAPAPAPTSAAKTKARRAPERAPLQFVSLDAFDANRPSKPFDNLSARKKPLSRLVPPPVRPSESRASTPRRAPAVLPLPPAPQNDLLNAEFRTPRTAPRFLPVPSSSKTPLKALHAPALPPPPAPSFTPAARPLAPPMIRAPAGPAVPLKPLSTTAIARLSGPGAAADGGALLAAALAARAASGAPVYVPPALRPLLAGLRASPRRPGHAAGADAVSVRGGLADAARGALTRAKRATGLWRTERTARVGAGPPGELQLRVRAVLGAFRPPAALAPGGAPPRAMLVRAVVERVRAGANGRLPAAKQEAYFAAAPAPVTDAHEEVPPLVPPEGALVWLLLGFGADAQARAEAERVCAALLAADAGTRVVLSVWAPWSALALIAPGALAHGRDGPAAVGVPARRRRPAEIPLPSPLDGARRPPPRPPQEEDNGTDPIAVLFAERFAVVIE
jgi:hypothetical protein